MARRVTSRPSGVTVIERAMALKDRTRTELQPYLREWRDENAGDHRMIFEAIARRDPEGAARAMARHFCLRAASIYSGTSETQRNLIARQLLG